MARPKYLLPIEALDKAVSLAELGVPITKIHGLLKLDWSYQSTVDLIKADMAGKHSATRPSWLKGEEGTALIAQPPNWRFRGYFPDGEWVQIG